jgi:hypothetical protein
MVEMDNLHHLLELLENKDRGIQQLSANAFIALVEFGRLICFWTVQGLII